MVPGPHFQAPLGETPVEITALQGQPGEFAAQGIVGRVTQHVPFLLRIGLDGLGKGRVLGGRAFHREIQLLDAHRLAPVDFQVDMGRRLGIVETHGQTGVVVAEGAQRLGDEATDLGLEAFGLVLGLVQTIEIDFDVVGQLSLDAFDRGIQRQGRHCHDKAQDPGPEAYEHAIIHDSEVFLTSRDYRRASSWALNASCV
ncbi:hypothetical protein A8U91_00734 [Halomonas elongata]|uniref:Uncharacterized protein n=1 Tax=Halomonas elongata TaxID=2746 RepID=A0A1B8P2C4_HALEL|nr:hypothetical protein A8U91_00734 [Halomonas elongata]